MNVNSQLDERFAVGLQAPSMHSQSVLWDNRQADTIAVIDFVYTLSSMRNQRFWKS